MMRATFPYLHEDTVPQLYKALLEYGNIIWHPRYRVDKFDRRATKIVSHIKDDPYESQLKAQKLTGVQA